MNTHPETRLNPRPHRRPPPSPSRVDTCGPSPTRGLASCAHIVYTTSASAPIPESPMPLPASCCRISFPPGTLPRFHGVLVRLPAPFASCRYPPRPHPALPRGPVLPGFREPTKKAAKTLSRQPDPYGVGLAREGSPFIPHASTRTSGTSRGPGRLTERARPDQYGARQRCERPAHGR